MEKIERRLQRLKVIMFPGEKSFDSWDEMVTYENFPEEAIQKYRTHRTKVIDQTFNQPGHIHTMFESVITVRYRIERWRLKCIAAFYLRR